MLSIRKLDTAAMIHFGHQGVVSLTVDDDGEVVELTREDAAVSVTPTPGFGAREERGLTVIADLAIDEDLKLEGAARELINRLQNLRKQSGLDVTDRIRLRYDGGLVAERVFGAQGSLIAGEALADDVARGSVDWDASAELDLDGERVTVWLQKSN